jgi:hypothetical protein
MGSLSANLTENVFGVSFTLGRSSGGEKRNVF